MDEQEGLAVFYLLRGADYGWKDSLDMFINSYQKYPPGSHHELVIIYKGFDSKKDLTFAQKKLDLLETTPLFLDDAGFDIGAYIKATKEIDSKYNLYLNSFSHFSCQNWLTKYAINIKQKSVGIIGATASFESLSHVLDEFPEYPSIHIRSNGFMINKELFLKLTNGVNIVDKVDAFKVESGINSLTNQVLRLNLKAYLLGCNGRVYPPHLWPTSNTFRQCDQRNLILQDNQTDNYRDLTFREKIDVYKRTWGNVTPRQLNKMKKYS